MTPEFIDQAVAALIATYGAEHVRRASEGGRILVRIDELEMPPGCKPETTPVMLVFDPSQPKPLPYLQPGQLLANGKVPTSTSAVMVGGESWMQFSFNIPWDETNGITRFVAAARQRFAQMNDVQLRVPLGLGHRLHETVFARGNHEDVVFCLVSHAVVDGTTVLFVRRVLGLDESDYVDDASCGAAWRGTSMVPIIEAAMAEDLGVVLVHAHSFGDPPRLSRPDIDSAQRILPMFQRRVPGRPHGSIVLSPGSAGGIIALPGKLAETMKVSVRWMGTSIIEWPLDATTRTSDFDVFERQALVVGDQSFLARARVAVVGLCGGGSHVVQQLAYSGVGTIIGIDADVCDGTNGHRNVGMRPRDAKVRRRKVYVMDRMVRTIGTGSTFVGVDARVPEPKAVQALKAADIIVGSVDNLHARADLQEIAWRNVIPYVDIGVSIRALKGDAAAPRVAIGGNVYVFIPGGFCGWCCGFISDEKLKAERDGRDDRSYFQNKKGEAQVVSFNGVVASQAVSEVIQLLTGFRGASVDPKSLLLHDGGQRGALKLDGRRGTLEDWGARRRPRCPCCKNFIGAGAVVWKAAS